MVCKLRARFHNKVISNSHLQKPIRNPHIEKDYLWVVVINYKRLLGTRINTKSNQRAKCQMLLFILTNQSFNIWLISNIKVQNMRYKCIVFFIVVKCSNILLPSYSRFFFKCLFVSQTLLTTNKSKVNCACLKNPLWMDEVRSSQNTGIVYPYTNSSVAASPWVGESGMSYSCLHINY